MGQFLAATMLLIALLSPAAAQAERTWQPPADFSAAGQQPTDLQAHDLAVDPKGNAVAVWGAQKSDDYIIQAATRPAGGNWSEPEVISGVARHAGGPKVGIDGAGNAVAVWYDTEESFSKSVIQASTRRMGGGPVRDGWSDVETLTPVDEKHFFPRLDVDELGNAVAVWENTPPSSAGTRLYAAIRTPGAARWGARSALSSSEDYATPYGLAVTRGKVAVGFVYSSPATSAERRAAAVATATVGGDWSVQEVAATATTTGDPNEAPAGLDAPAVAVDGEGHVAAVWSISPPVAFEQSRIQAATGMVGTTNGWSATEDLTTTEQLATDYRVEVDGQGDATAAWTRVTRAALSTTHAQVETATRPKGGSWSDIPQVISPVQQNAMLTDMAVSPPGDAVAVWRRFEGSSGGGFANTPPVNPTYTPVAAVRSAAGNWGAGQDLSIAGKLEPSPQVGMDAAGDALAVWSREASGTTGLTLRSAAYEDPNAPVVPPPTGDDGGGTGTGASPTTTTGGTTTGTVLGTGAPQAGTGPVAFVASTPAMRLALRRCITRANRQSTRARRRAARIRCARAGRPGGPRASAISASEIILSFRAPGSAGRGGPPARRYLIKQSTRPIRSERDFGRALTLCGRTCAFTPRRRGQRLSLRITGLRSRRTYYYAVKALGAGRRTGPPSSTARAQTR